MRTVLFSLLTAAALLGAGQGWAQQLPVATDSAARPAASSVTAVAGATDVIVRTNGDELPARVLRITPQVVQYLPVPLAAADPLSAPASDTLLLPAAEVFMIRYANGTKEVLRSVSTSASVPDPRAAIVGLSAPQRYEQGRRDSRRYYKPAQGVFWGTFVGTVATAGYGGLVVGTAVTLTAPPRGNLNAPEPALLNDPAYYNGYAQQAKNRKLGKAAAGFGVGMGTLLVLFTLFAAALSGGV